MRRVIKQIGILAILFFVGEAAIGQETKLTEEQKAQMEVQLNEYNSKLDLSEAQKPKFEEITLKYGKQMMELKESGKGRLAKYKEFKSIRKNRNEEMELVLSDEQYEAYLEIQEEMQEKMKENNKNKS
ncbi:MAG: hypothetical protein AAGD17_10940 [Bacteroidota bacterium]